MLTRLFFGGRRRAAVKTTTRLTVESLEGRLVPAAPPGFGPLPAVTIGLTPEQIDRADAVINWNATALRAVWNAAASPTHSSRVYAMVSVAVYDAVNAITPIAEMYPIPGLTGKPGPQASAEAAAIAAADTVLRSLYPAQAALLDAEYAFTLASVPSGPARAQGLAWGQKVAQALLAWRAADDVRPTVPEYTPAPPGGPPGEYQLTPGATFALTPQWGQQTTWALTSGDQFLSPPPPALDSPRYAADFNEVKAVGVLNSPVRTADQTEFAHFWAGVPGNSAAPPGHINEIAARVALLEDLSLAENARLFALLNIGLADAAINCWEAKYVYDLWRPATAITDPRARDINPRTTTDPGWVPQWQSPPFPTYTSGHSTFSATGAAILTSLFGPNYRFTLGSDDMPGVARSFDSFLDAAEEAADSRLYGGIHFRFDNEAGLVAGLQIGNFVARNYLQAREATAFLQIDAHRRNEFVLFVGGSNRGDVLLVERVGTRTVVLGNGRLLGAFDLPLGVNGITVDARDGDDVVFVSSRITTDAELFGGKGDDALSGGSGNDRIFGEDGNDYLFGNDGDDLLDGGRGRDLLFGGPGRDTLRDGPGFDLLFP
jgi:hypothetical protein